MPQLIPSSVPSKGPPPWAPDRWQLPSKPSLALSTLFLP